MTEQAKQGQGTATPDLHGPHQTPGATARPCTYQMGFITRWLHGHAGTHFSEVSKQAEGPRGP